MRLSLRLTMLPTIVWLLWLALVTFSFIAVFEWLFPSVIPFKMFELWHTKGTLWEWVTSVWIIFAWGAGLTALISLLTTNTPWVNRYAEGIMIRGFFTSLWAGVMEEVLFRWLVFFTSIVGLKIFNFFLLGFVGLGVLKFWYLWVMGPLANFVTLGAMEDVLFRHPGGWAVGAAVLASNGFFRDGHKYQGWFGLVNSWFIGMVMFWLLFRYGLVAAIVVHFLYDLFIDIVRYIDAAIERALGWV